jgi:hypothetical protein
MFFIIFNKILIKLNDILTKYYDQLFDYLDLIIVKIFNKLLEERKKKKG